MHGRKKLYLAGPDVFRDNAKEHFDLLKRLSEQYGMEGISPFDSDVQMGTSGEIFRTNVSIMDRVDAIIANIVPFRGIGVDDGTAFELGYGFAKGLKLYGYSRTFSKTYEEIAGAYPMLVNEEYPLLEGFGQTCNLMIAEAILERGGNIFESFEECLIHYKNSF